LLWQIGRFGRRRVEVGWEGRWGRRRREGGRKRWWCVEGGRENGKEDEGW